MMIRGASVRACGRIWVVSMLAMGCGQVRTVMTMPAGSSDASIADTGASDTGPAAPDVAPGKPDSPPESRRTRRKARRRPRLARRERRCSRGRRRHGPGHERRVRADQPYLRWRLRLAHRCRALRGELLPLLRADRRRGDVRWRQLWRFLSGRNEAVRGGVHSTRHGLQRRLFSGDAPVQPSLLFEHRCAYLRVRLHALRGADRRYGDL